jgi:hypothetical protein
MSLSPPPKPAHVAPAEEAHFYRNTILAANSRVVTEASSLQEDSAERGDMYPASGIISYAIGDRADWSTLYEFPDTGLSTLVEEVAFRHQSKGLRYVELAATVSVCNRLAAAERDLERIRASASWRWTASLRAVRDSFCRLVERFQKT